MLVMNFNEIEETSKKTKSIQEEGFINENIQISAEVSDPRITFTSDFLSLSFSTSKNHDWVGAKATHGISLSNQEFGSQFYYECKIISNLKAEINKKNDPNFHLCRLGWSTGSSSLRLGEDPFSFGYGGTGKKSFMNQYHSYGELFGLNDVVGTLLDTEKKQISFWKNGVALGVAFEIPVLLHHSNFFPHVLIRNVQVQLNFSGPSFCSNNEETWCNSLFLSKVPNLIHLNEDHPLLSLVNLQLEQSTKKAKKTPQLSRACEKCVNMMVAANHGHLNCAVALLEPLKTSEEKLKCVTYNGNRHLESPIHHAAVVGSISIIELLLANGEQINIQNKRGNTPLHLACMKGRSQVVDYLLSRGANPNLTNRKGFTPMQVCFKHKNSPNLSTYKINYDSIIQILEQYQI